LGSGATLISGIMQKQKRVCLSRWLLRRPARIFFSLFLAALFLSVSLPLSLGGTRISPSVAQEQLAPSAFVRQGQDLYERGDFAAAAIAWQQAEATFESQGDALNQAIALSNLSLTYQKLGEWEEARQAIAESLQILQQNPSSPNPALAQSLEIQGLLSLSTGKAQAALETWKQATTLYAQVGDRAGEVHSQLNQAQAMQVLGLHLQARKLLEKANQTLSSAADSLSKVKGLRSLGNVLRQMGELEASKARLEASLAVAQRLQLNSEVSATELDLGNTDRALGNKAKVFGDENKSRNYFNSALQRYKTAATSETPSVRLKALLNKLSLLLAIDRQEDAKSLLDTIQSAIAQFPPSRTKIFAQIQLAEGLMALGNPPKDIAKILAAAQQQSQKIGDARAESLALGSLGTLYERTEQWSEMENLTKQSLGLSQSIQAPDLSYRWQWQLGRAYQKLGARKSAIDSYTGAIATLQIVRHNLIPVDPDVRFSFRENVEPVYRELVDLLLSETANSEPTQDNLKQATETIDALQLAELEDFLRCNLSPIVKLSEQDVDTSAALIYPIILRDRVEVILKLPQPQQFERYTTLISEQEAQTTFKNLRIQLEYSYFSPEGLELAQTVYDWLIRPAELKLKKNQIKTLVFVLDGLLRNVPMAALHDGRQYLIEKGYAVALTPGLKLLQPQPLAEISLDTLTFGLSEVRENFPAHDEFSPLPNVPIELEQIQRNVPAQQFLNQDFTSATLRNRVLSLPFPIVHLATHGQFSSDPQQTFILAWDRKINIDDLSYILRLRERNRSEAIELLILSACKTAKGDRRATLGLAGIAVQSGARSTIATLWSVNDRSTAELMSLFYQELANNQEKIGKAEALRRAQVKLLNSNYQGPLHWAPYILVGNWQ